MGGKDTKKEDAAKAKEKEERQKQLITMKGKSPIKNCKKLLVVNATSSGETASIEFALQQKGPKTVTDLAQADGIVIMLNTILENAHIAKKAIEGAKPKALPIVGVWKSMGYPKPNSLGITYVVKESEMDILFE